MAAVGTFEDWCSWATKVNKNPTNFKKEAYRDGVKRKGDKIVMRCRTCFTYDFHVVSVVTLPECMTQSLYSLQLLLTCQSQYIVVQISTLVGQAL